MLAVILTQPIHANTVILLRAYSLGLINQMEPLAEHSTALILLPIQLEMTAQMFGVIINITDNVPLEIVYGLLKTATTTTMIIL
jgi:uncharacterized protein (DUF697 family)